MLLCEHGQWSTKVLGGRHLNSRCSRCLCTGRTSSILASVPKRIPVRAPILVQGRPPWQLDAHPPLPYLDTVLGSWSKTHCMDWSVSTTAGHRDQWPCTPCSVCLRSRIPAHSLKRLPTCSPPPRRQELESHCDQRDNRKCSSSNLMAGLHLPPSAVREIGTMACHDQSPQRHSPHT